MSSLVKFRTRRYSFFYSITPALIYFDFIFQNRSQAFFGFWYHWWTINCLPAHQWLHSLFIAFQKKIEAITRLNEMATRCCIPLLLSLWQCRPIQCTVYVYFLFLPIIKALRNIGILGTVVCSFCCCFQASWFGLEHYVLIYPRKSNSSRYITWGN